jgi:hypothetical protein
MDQQNVYIPGTCNIGPAERRMRRMSGWLGLGVTIILWGIFVAAHTPQVWRFFVFLPASMAATGFLQDAFHFCVNFGMRGLFNFGPEVGKTDNVLQAEFRKKDREKAMLILFLSMLIGAAVAAASVLIRV